MCWHRLSTNPCHPRAHASPQRGFSNVSTFQTEFAEHSELGAKIQSGIGHYADNIRGPRARVRDRQFCIFTSRARMSDNCAEANCAAGVPPPFFSFPIPPARHFRSPAHTSGWRHVSTRCAFLFFWGLFSRMYKFVLFLSALIHLHTGTMGLHFNIFWGFIIFVVDVIRPCELWFYLIFFLLLLTRSLSFVRICTLTGVASAIMAA